MDTKKQSKKRKNFESSEPPKVSKKFKKEDAKEIEKETIGKYEQPSNSLTYRMKSMTYSKKGEFHNNKSLLG